MPTFNFTSPEGRQYDVTGPDGATSEQAFAVLQNHLGASPPQPSATTGTNVSQSTPSTNTYQVGLQDGRTLQIQAVNQDAALAGAQHFLRNNPARPSVNITSDQVTEARQQGYTDDQIAGYLAQRYPDQFKEAYANGYSSTDILNHFAPPPSTLTDTAKGVAKGIATGTEGLLGLPGDFQKGVDWAMDKVMPSSLFGLKGAFPGDPNAYAPPSISRLPTTSDVDSVLHASSLPDPQTSVGQHAQNVASFLPSAIGGPESVAKNLLVRGVLPGAASDALGTATQGTALEPYARMAGALVAPSGAAADALPTTEQLLAAGSQGRNAFRSLPFATRDGVMQQWAADTLDDFQNGNKGFYQANAPQTHSILQDIANHNGSAWTSDLDSWQDRLSNVSGTPREEAAALAAKRALEDRMTSFTPAQTLMGDPDEVARTWNEAQANYAAGMRSQAVNAALDTAQANADAANNGHNVGNATRSQFKKFVTNDVASQGFSPDEMAQANRVVSGTTTGNLLRSVSSGLGGGGGIMQGLAVGAGGYLGSQSGEPGGTAVGAVAPLIFGALARRGANSSVLRQAANLDQLVRSRAPLAGGAGALQLEILRRALIRRIAQASTALRTGGGNNGNGQQ